MVQKNGPQPSLHFLFEVRNAAVRNVSYTPLMEGAGRLLSLGSSTQSATCHLNLAYNNAGAGNQFQTFEAEL